MLEKDKVRKRKKDNKWQPTREQYQRMAIRHDTLLEHAKKYADDPTGILSALYHDIIDKYCNLRAELRTMRQEAAENRRMIMILKMALERKNQQSTQEEEAERW